MLLKRPAATGRSLALIIFLLLSAAGNSRGAANSRGDYTRYVPLDHPLYDYLDRLQERGRLQKLNSALRPYTRFQLLEALEAQPQEGLKPCETEWLKVIREQCELEIRAAGSPDSAKISVITRLEASQSLSNIRPGRSRNTAGAGFGGRLGQVVFDCRFLRAPQLMQLQDSTSHRDPDVVAPREEGLIRPMEGYLKGDFRLRGGAFSTEIFFGRLARNWSPGLTQSLILGSNALSFDHFALTLRSRHLQLTQLAAVLDGMSYYQPPDRQLVRARRYFTAHRLDIRVRDYLRFGITETAVYGGAERGLDLSLLNPFTSYRLAAIQNKTDHENNSFLALDGYYAIGGRLSLYGQFLFDDFLRNDRIQDRWALDLGASWRDLPLPRPSTLGLKATLVSSFAYNTFAPYERYILNGRPLGAPLGNDYWKLYGYLRIFLTPELDLKAHFTRQERGKERIASPAATLLYSGGLAFPAPPVERRSEIGLALRWKPCGPAQLVAEAGFFRESGLNNLPGVRRSRGYATIFLSFYHDLVISF